MRRTLILFLALLFSAPQLFAQQYDKVWVFGNPMAKMTFESDTIINDDLAAANITSFLTIGNICDKKGKLLFYTNGVRVYNVDGYVMPHGDSLSAPSPYYDQIYDGGMPSQEGVVTLPDPGDTNRYYLFHYTPTDSFNNTAGGLALNFYYSIVDMRLDAGKGDVVSKNNAILQNESLSWSRLAACRHANGRDWWIIKNAWQTNIYYEFLLTPTGIQGPLIQQIGLMYGIGNEQPAYSNFSPDGTMYASCTAQSEIVLMNFDRCSGEFSNPRSIFNQIVASNYRKSGACSLAFSPENRYLYVCDRLSINQYDVMANRLNDSIRIVTGPDDTTNIYQMGVMQLAPNGKIYVGCWNGGIAKMSVIDQPDSFGIACRFLKLGQNVKTINATNLPYFPNYRLSALLGSCDTITSVPNIVDAYPDLSISPNPATTNITLTTSLQELTLSISDLTGRNYAVQHTDRDIDISSLSAGIYTLRMQTIEGSAVRRFVKE